MGFLKIGTKLDQDADFAEKFLNIPPSFDEFKKMSDLNELTKDVIVKM